MDLTVALPEELAMEVADLTIISDHWYGFVGNRGTVALLNRRWAALVRSRARYWRIIYVHRFTPLSSLRAWVKAARHLQEVYLRIDSIPRDSIPIPGKTTRPVECPTMQYFLDVVVAELRPICDHVVDANLRSNGAASATAVLGVLMDFGLPNLHRLDASGENVGTSPRLEPEPFPTIPALGVVSLDSLDPNVFGVGLFRHITALRLGRMWSMSRPNCAHILDVLEGVMALQLLQMESVECLTIPAQRAVNLPTLLHFSFSCDFNACLAIITALRMPALRSLRLCLGGRMALSSLHGLAPGIFRTVTRMHLKLRYPSAHDIGPAFRSANHARVIDFSGSTSTVAQEFLKVLDEDTRSHDDLRLLHFPLGISRGCIHNILSSREIPGGVTLTTAITRAAIPCTAWRLLGEQLIWQAGHRDEAAEWMECNILPFR